MKILILNGPNLNTLGTREPGIYGTRTLDDLEKLLTGKFPDDTFEFLQSNEEGTLVTRLNGLIEKPMDGVVMNPGAFTHYSYALRDAVGMLTIPIVEVHISNIYARESFRKKSVIAAACTGQISGFGINGYFLAVEAIKQQHNFKKST